MPCPPARGGRVERWSPGDLLASRRRRDADPNAFVARAVRRALWAPLLLTTAFAGIVVLEVVLLRSSLMDVERAQTVTSLPGLSVALGVGGALYARRDIVQVSSA